MGREWQQTRFKEYVMPDAVYYQSIWCVRDLERMEKRIAELNADANEGFMGSSSLVSDNTANYQDVRPTEDKALELALLEGKVSGIYSAMALVPEAYRECIFDNIIRQKSNMEFPNKIWKIWKQRFLFHVAKNLSLM